jgi:hypothetical protein
MDPKSIVRSLDKKGWAARKIHDDLIAALGEDSIGCGAWVRRESTLPLPRHYRAPFHSTSTNQTKLTCKLLKNSHSILFSSTAHPRQTATRHHVLQIYHLGNLSLPRVIFNGWRIVYQMIRR